MHYETEENYYVFIQHAHAASMRIQVTRQLIRVPDVPGVSDNHECLTSTYYGSASAIAAGNIPAGCQRAAERRTCYYIDPNPISII